MDPDTTRLEILDLCREVRNDYRREPAQFLGYDLVKKIEALDEWLTKGGFLPEAWRGDTPC